METCVSSLCSARELWVETLVTAVVGLFDDDGDTDGLRSVDWVIMKVRTLSGVLEDFRVLFHADCVLPVDTP